MRVYLDREKVDLQELFAFLYAKTGKETLILVFN